MIRYLYSQQEVGNAAHDRDAKGALRWPGETIIWRHPQAMQGGHPIPYILTTPGETAPPGYDHTGTVTDERWVNNV